MYQESTVMFEENVFSNAVDAVFMMDAKYHFIDVNDIACKTLGYTKDELKQMSILDIDPTMTEQKYKFLVDNFYDQDNTSRQIVTQHKTKSDEILDVEITTSTFSIADQQYRISIAKDITIQKQTIYEHTLLKFAYDNNSNGSFLIDEAGNHIYANHYLCKMLEYSLDELLSKTVYDVNPDINPEDWPTHWETLKEMGSLRFDSHNQNKSGEIFPVEIFTNYFEFEGKGYNIGSVRDITQDKKLQGDLVKREWEFRSLANNIPDNIGRWDTKGRYLYVNKKLLTTLQKSLGEVIGKTVSEIFPDGRFSGVEKALLHVIETQRPYQVNKLPQWIDGKIRYHDLNFTPEFDDNGNFVSILTIGRDMTERYDLQDEILKKEELYHFLLESIPANIVLWDKDARYVYANSVHLEKTVQVPFEDIEGKTVKEAFPDGRFETMEDIVHNVIETKKMVKLSRIPVESEEIHHEVHDVYLIPHLDQEQNVHSILGVGLDMSEHYILQEQLEAQEEQLRLIVETLPGAVGIFHLKDDKSTAIPYISPSAKEIFGVEDQKIMKNTKRLLALLNPKDVKKLQRAMLLSSRTMTPWRQEYRIKHPVKKERWLETHAKPVKHPQGGIMWFGYIHDISERKKLEKQIGLVSIGQLSAGITHEINTPLTYIKGRLELMNLSVDDITQEEIKNELNSDLISIQDGVIRMSHIISSMREIAGKSKDTKEDVSIYNSLIMTLVMIHNRAKYIANIYLNDELFNLDLKKDESLFVAHVERQRIEQVWIIVLNNALDALEQTKKFDEAKINIDVKETKKFINVTITDNAGGIPEELLPTIFEPFSSTKEYGGMGIGLNIAKGIVDEQDGAIDIKNLQDGVVATISLPKK